MLSDSKTISKSNSQSLSDLQLISGPQKVRRRYTKAIIGIVTGLVVDHDELADFWTWFDINLQGGVNTFNMTNPITKTVKEARFLQPPRMTPIDDSNFNLELILETF